MTPGAVVVPKSQHSCSFAATLWSWKMPPEVARVALVTAGSAGLGAAVARVLAVQCGMSVVINYSSNSERAEALVSWLCQETATQEQPRETCRFFHAIQADLHQPAEIRRLVSETLALSRGRLDAVVSNVGWTRMTDFSDLEQGVVEADWDRCFNVNVKGHLWLFHAAQTALAEADGVFVSTASVAGVRPSGSSLVNYLSRARPSGLANRYSSQPYAVTKAAQIHLIKSLALIAAPKVRVNCVSPGVLLTVSPRNQPFLLLGVVAKPLQDWGKTFSRQKLDAVREANGLKRFATVEDVAQQVRVFVESKSATGQNAIIDAGFLL